ncbi:MAG: pseudouridine synthase [Nitrosopumilaceae archaeon]|nr:pseudouridine synthase [Nitrosopumilaceae archaeon]NIP09327.1 pseudouridine synthase [Nitrosopumilaceae archaeon]NIS94970.1 pseudouridine synthase [Nitrosopumilaceae archaeon]
MSSIQEITPLANKIMRKHFLCDSCLGRLFSKNLKLSSDKLLGKKLKQNISKSKTCYICKNLFDDLSPYLKLMLESSSKYQFSSFLVGAKIKPSIIDRDDYIRSKYRLQGIDSIKTSLTHELAKKFSRKTKKIFEHLNPDITLTLNIKDHTCHLRSKHVSLQGRYKKIKRGILQKQKQCSNCSGKGCRTCNMHGLDGYDSIEGKISEILFQKFGGTTARFNWLGGEDKSSLVLGTGRPFFVRIQNPVNRNIRFPKTLKINSLEVLDLKIISDTPRKPIPFKSQIKIKISAKNPITSKKLKKLKQSLKSPVVIYESSGRRSEKKIFDTKYKKNSENTFTLSIDAEGGLPVKRFVSGDNVFPGVGQIIDNICKCEHFDFIQIQMITNN